MTELSLPRMPQRAPYKSTNTIDPRAWPRLPGKAKRRKVSWSIGPNCSRTCPWKWVLNAKDLLYVSFCVPKSIPPQKNISMYIHMQCIHHLMPWLKALDFKVIDIKRSGRHDPLPLTHKLDSLHVGRRYVIRKSHMQYKISVKHASRAGALAHQIQFCESNQGHICFITIHQSLNALSHWLSRSQHRIDSDCFFTRLLTQNRPGPTCTKKRCSCTRS